MKNKEYHTKSGKPIRLWQGDCMELMRQDEEWDLAIVDPPYGIKADSKNSSKELKSKKSAALSNDYGDQQWDDSTPNEEYFDILKSNTLEQIIWGANFYGLKGGYIYWHKNVTMPTYSDGELAFCSKINSIKYFECTWHGMIQHDMKNKEERIHPTQKPVKLYRWLLSNYADDEDTILDTHGGSMSLAIACYMEDFELDIIELDEDYYNDAVKRFEQHISQKTLF